MKTLILLFALIVGAVAVEPDIPGVIVADVVDAFPGGLTVDWTVKKKAQPKRGDVIAIEWGSGTYFTTVLAVHHDIVFTDYTPTSVEVDLPATVRLIACQPRRATNRTFVPAGR